MELMELNGKHLIMCGLNEEFEFTTCRSADNCFSYKKRWEELTKQETDLLLAELLKNQENGK